MGTITIQRWTGWILPIRSLQICVSLYDRLGEVLKQPYGVNPSSLFSIWHGETPLHDLRLSFRRHSLPLAKHPSRLQESQRPLSRPLLETRPQRPREISTTSKSWKFVWALRWIQDFKPNTFTFTFTSRLPLKRGWYIPIGPHRLKLPPSEPPMLKTVPWVQYKEDEEYSVRVCNTAVCVLRGDLYCANSS